MKMIAGLLVMVSLFLSGCKSDSIHYFPPDKYMQMADGHYVKTIVEVNL